MGNDVTIKANSHGIVIVLDAALSYDRMITAIKNKFRQSSNIFSDKCDMPVTIKGPTLTNEEYHLLLEQLNDIDGIKTHFIEKCSNTAQIEKYPASVQKTKTKPLKNTVTELPIQKPLDNYIFKGTLKQGEELVVRHSIIIIGDVEKDAQVISGGNIIVLGNLMGRAIAGRTKNPDRFILALYMQPEYIQIGNACQEFPKQIYKKCTTDEAVIAYRNEKNIYMEYVSKSTVISNFY